MGKLNDKVAIITGGASGIGEAIVLGLAAEGAHICIADIHRDKADTIKTRVEGLKRKAIAIKTDVSRQGDTRWMVEQTMNV